MVSSSSSVPDLGFGRVFSQFQWPPSPVNGDRTAKADEPAAEAKTADRTGTNDGLSRADQAVIAELQRVDQRVRAHERAHVTAGDGVVRGGASFSFTRGPDGRNYAVAGEVPIDASPGRTPEETLVKAAAIQRAALAPADPSSTDLRIAAKGQAMAAEAALELARQRARAGDERGAEQQTGVVRGDATALYLRTERGAAAGLSALLAIA